MRDALLMQQNGKRQESQPSSSSEHELRNKFNNVSISIALAQKLVECGRTEEAQRALRVAEGVLTRERDRFEPLTLTCLLVDDAENERQLLAEFLTLCGFIVHTAGDGFEAMEYLQSNMTPDLILMDMAMPGLSGAEAIREIRSQAEFDHVRIFGVSGWTADEAGIEQQSDRVSLWFQKPIEPWKLVAAIDESVVMRRIAC